MTDKELIYISGPITGVENYMERFAAAQEYLRSCGFESINPAYIFCSLPKAVSWAVFMKLCLTLVEQSTGIYLLDGWEQSRGCTCEMNLARKIGVPRITDSYLEKRKARWEELQHVMAR